MTATVASRPALLIRAPQEITVEWLSAVLEEQVGGLAGVERIGTGQMSHTYRATFTGVDGAIGTIVVKLASEDEQSRGTGVKMGAYWREIAFYSGLAQRIGGPLAHCHLAEYDATDGWFTLVLDDITDGRVGDQIAGCSVAEARIAMRTLAQVHAPVINDLAVGALDYLNQPNPLTQALLEMLLPAFLDRYSDRVLPEHADVLRRFVPVADAWGADRRPPLGLTHGDYRLDNLIFAGDACTVVDWQTVAWGSAFLDVAYFLGGGLDPADRRAHERELVGSYVEELRALGVSGLEDEACWDEYRRQVFHGVVMAVVAAMVVGRTERGDDMFMTSLDRFCRQILDLESLSLLPEPGAAPVALRPEPADEGRHDPGPEWTWNESWYFDVVDDSGELGVYVRLGRMPNQDCSVYMASIVRRGHGPVLLLDVDAPLPPTDDDRQVVDTDGLHTEQECIEALQTFRVSLTGTAREHGEDSAALRDEAGTPMPIAIDLEWQTDGVPYAWRQSTRYEIPCRVAGTVRIGDETLTVAGAGQRDHSWGPRDWWAADWMWSAFHLDDGTRTHVVTVPQLPGYAVGYVQRGGQLTEVQTATTTDHFTEDGLVATATIASSPPELAQEIEPLMFSTLALVAPDGRRTHFVRAAARVRTADGRTGVGWIEWNRNQH